MCPISPISPILYARAAIALGSNIGDRLGYLRTAYREVASLSTASAGVKRSSIYQTTPVDSPPGAPLFLNAVVEIEFDQPATVLLDALLEIERSLGRPSQRPKNAPRIIDLDLLYLDNITLHTPRIILPHPGIARRRFVLEPLAEIAPDLVLPGLTVSIGNLLTDLKTGEEVTRMPQGLCLV